MTRKDHMYRGWKISPGSYRGGSDDIEGRWYLMSPEEQEGDTIDRRGSGFYTLADAKQRIDEIIDEE
jgi:hypothetical protein